MHFQGSLEGSLFNVWLLAAPLIIAFGAFLLSRRRSVAVAIVASAALHLALAFVIAVQSDAAANLPEPVRNQEILPIVEFPRDPVLGEPLVKDSPVPSPPEFVTNLPPQVPGDVPPANSVLIAASSTKLPKFPSTTATTINSLALPSPDLASTFPKTGNISLSTVNLEVLARLKEKGGQEGKITVTLMWFNRNDLDIHVFDPNGNVVRWNAVPPFRQQLDVDANANPSIETDRPVENIRWLQSPPHGTYKVIVDHFRISKSPGCEGPTKFIVRIKIEDREPVFFQGEVTWHPGHGVENPELKICDFTYPPPR